jgi:dolichyl-diphosphooligosaccharide--protein glycosyltransferase
MDQSYPDGRSGPTWWRRHGKTVIALTLIVLLAGFLRIAFNYGPAMNHGTIRYAGNDDYYHFRVVEEVERTGHHVVLDPLLNYPVPALNPRPPLYDWHVAIVGQIFGFATGEATPGHAAVKSGAYILEWGSAFWGTISVIPIWLIGRAAFNNRVGLWAAFLLAASPAHIQRAGFGLGDHDAFIVFFLLMGAYFLVRALQLTRDDVRVASWRSIDSVATGFGEYAAAHAEGLAYALLAGVFWGAIGLMWEGFPYVLAVYSVYYVIQLVSNQIRRRDSTGDFLIFSIITATGIAMIAPNYWITGNLGSTLNSYVYVIAILCVLSLALIPTRDLPWILVLPTLVGIALLGYIVLRFVFPDVGALLLSANGYFNQSKLYSTIAEAQRTELGVFVFSIGFMTFFALVGFVMAIVRYLKFHERALLFLVGWAALSIYMGFAATRFVFNAAPIFAVLGGWVTVRIVDWMNFKERLKNFQSARQDSFWKATRSTMGAKQIAGSLFILLFLIVPNLWFSVDAGIPSEFRDNYRKNHPNSQEFLANRTGAFGQGFLDPNWLVVYGYLDHQDTELRPEQRPAHIAWWDYGFWEIAIAHHPSVSDNFQNGHQLAGRFLAAQSEKEALEWLSIRLIEGDWGHHHRAISAPVNDLLRSYNASWPSKIDGLVIYDHYDDIRHVLLNNLKTLNDTVGFYDALRATTGFSIEYFIVDNRMLPFDDPSTPYIDSGSILYAPIFLAGQNPDDFVQTTYTDTQGNTYFVVAYERDPVTNDTRQAHPPRTVDASGQCHFVSGGQVYRATKDCKRIDFTFNNGQGVQLKSTSLKFKDAYYNTMFYRGFVGGGKPPFGDYPQEAFVGNGTSGKDLRHFRWINGTHSVKLLQYYSGAVVSGRVSLTTGASLAGFTVAAQDGRGIDHDAFIVGADGRYTVHVPFSLPGEPGTKIALKQAGSVLVAKTLNVTKQDANAHRNFTVDIQIEPASLSGFVYFDKDRSGTYNQSIDSPLQGAVVHVDNQNVTTGADGHFTITNVLPGSKAVTATKAGFKRGTQSASLKAGASGGNVTIPMAAASVPVNGTLHSPKDGKPLPSVSVDFVAKNPAKDHTQNTSAFTDGGGNFTASVEPGGGYLVRVNATLIENNRTVRYRGETSIDVPFGSPPIKLDATKLALTRTEE